MGEGGTWGGSWEKLSAQPLPSPHSLVSAEALIIYQLEKIEVIQIKFFYISAVHSKSSQFQHQVKCKPLTTDNQTFHVIPCKHPQSSPLLQLHNKPQPCTQIGQSLGIWTISVVSQKNLLFSCSTKYTHTHTHTHTSVGLQLELNLFAQSRNREGGLSYWSRG